MIPRKIMYMLLSVGLLLSFFMPWFAPVAYDVFNADYLKPGNGIAGYEVNNYERALAAIPGLEQVRDFTGKGSPSPLYYAVFLIPAFAVASIVTSLIGSETRTMILLTGGLPILGFGLLFIQFGARLPNHMTYGSFMTLACGLSILAVALTRN